MRRFVLNVFVVLAVACLMVAIANVMVSSRMRSMSYRLPDSIHTIAFGHSTTACALADAPEEGFMNLSKTASHLRYINPVLDSILSANPQIDTVWLAHGRYSMKYEVDSISSKSFSFARSHLPFFFSYEQPEGFWKAFFSSPSSYQALFTIDPLDFSQSLSKSSLWDYGFRPEERHRSCIPDAVAWYDKEAKARGGNVFGLQCVLDSFPRTHAAQVLAIDICRRHGVVPVLFLPPLYNMERWYELKGFAEYLATYDPDLLVADYEDFEFPDDSYHRDIQHLNVKGQRFFTDYLLKNGVRYVTIRQWLAEKGF